MKKSLDKIINGKFIDPESGKPFVVPIDYVVIDSKVKDNAFDYINKLDLGKKCLVASDENTFEVLGALIVNCLKDSCLSTILPLDVHANQDAVDKIRTLAKDVDYIIAVGSGTINDLCKYASFLEGKPYIVFPTAPSMNGYSSANAAITVNGHKKSLAAHLPRAIFCDLDILTAAPKRLIRSGLGDSICRSTAQIDWYLSHCLLGTDYSDVPFDWLKEYEGDLLDNSSSLMCSDADVMRLLVQTLIISGLGMYYANGSYPASQAEHMIAHTIDMLCDGGAEAYHGEQIGVTTLTMVGIQEAVINKLNSFDMKGIAFGKEEKEKIISFYGEEIGFQCIEQYQKKHNLLRKVAGDKNEWADKVREKYFKVSISSEQIQKILKGCGCPVNPSEIGVDGRFYNDVVAHAKFMRDRLTFLDFV